MTRIKTKANQDLLRGLKRLPTKKVVLLYSAGADSTAAGLKLIEQGYKVFPLFIDYGQSALKAEKYLALKSAKTLGFESCRLLATDLFQQLTKSKLLGKKSLEDVDAWVPGRNTLFMVIAAIYAKQIDADGLGLGYTLDDNFVFGDNDYFHHLIVEQLMSKSFLRPMAVFLPLMSLTKKEVLKLLGDKKALDLTVSCWNAKLQHGQIISCRRCANCVEREKSESAPK